MKQRFLLKTMLLLCALVVGSSSVWATTYKSYTGGVEQKSTTISSSNVSAGSVGVISWTGTSCTYSSSRVNIAANGSITFTASSGYNITKIVIVSGSSSSYYGTWTSSPSVTPTSSSGTTTFDGLNANSVTVTTSTDFRCTSASSISIHYEAVAAGTTAAPSITGNSPFFGSTTATITNAASADGAKIYYTMGADPADPTTSSTEYSAPIAIDATTTVKAIAKKSTDTNASSVVSKTFTKVTPINVASALTAINALANNGTIADQAVRGIVTKVTSLYNGTAINYTISDDVAGSNELTVYRGRNMHNTDFSALSDLKLGDDVVIYGTLKKFVSGTNTTPEFDAGSYLLYQVSKTAPTFTLSTTAETLSMGTTETADVTLTTNTDGAITCESSDDDVATVALKSAGVYTITGHMAGTATITIKSALTVNYQPASATVDITVTDTREEAGISFANDAEEITWGDAYTGQALTNTHSLSVTWSSTDETVATVNASGVVTVLKAGSTEIKASFAGNSTYKTSVVAYTLTVKKASADLSYAQTEFEIMLNDDSFVAPTLNNPNGLTVTYSSNNETLALVDENTGVLTYDEKTAGTATITAYFAGNDNYKAGNAKYTINVVDPTAKGSKYNPYTVTEVINGTATGDNIYVRGFIVGEYVGKTTNPRTSSFTTDANIAIAEAFTTSPTAGGSIPVALPSDALKSAWGCQTSNGALLGYEILVKGNKDTYFSVNGIKGTSEVAALSVPVAITAAGLATYASDYTLDYTNVDGIEAYIAKENAGVISMTKVNKVPAGTGVLLRATAGGTNFTVPVANTADDVTGNLFVRGNDAAVETGTGPYNYILNNGSAGLGFYRANGKMVAKNRAYLQTTINATTAPFLNFNFDGEATGIENVKGETITNNEYYNLNGQRVAQPTKGLYIVNGKKVVIK